MHLLLLHGYLLRGTGSNIYVANIAKAWRNQGHAVTVVCQERRAATLPFVQEYVGPDDAVPATPPERGTIRVIVPAIDDLLPVFVLEQYEGFRVKTIPTMTRAEIEKHIEMTAAVLHRVTHQGVNRVLANHVLLGPVIASRALRGTGVPYDVKVHGSALEYTLVPNPSLMDFAVEGLGSAKKVFAGTRHVRQRMLEVFAPDAESLELDGKLGIVPPGMDPDLFQLSDDITADHARLVAKIEAKIRENPNGRPAQVSPRPGNSVAEFHAALTRRGETYERRAIDADLLERWPTLQENEPVIVYVGNFLDEKGVGELLLTVPTILSRIPEIRFCFVGFGPYREHLSGMIEALGSGDRGLFRACAAAGRFVTEGDVDEWYRPLTAAEYDRITVTGMLDHDILSGLLPLASVSIVPSKWPEAFGMVAVEAMASGVLPICNYHAGLRDVIDAVRSTEPALADLMSLDRERFVTQLPDKVEAALAYLYPNGFHDGSQRRTVGESLRRIAVEHFSWDEIAGRLLR